MARAPSTDHRETTSEVVEPNWLDVTHIGSNYEEQIDINSRRGASRHRLRGFTGDRIDDWKDGPTPT